MSGAQSISTRRAYGVKRVCRVWARPRSSVYMRRQAPRNGARWHRRGSVGAAPEEVLVATSAGCLRHRRFMVRATGKSGRSCGSRGFGPRRSGCVD